MDKDLLYLVDLSSIKLDEATGQPTSSWIHGLPLGEYAHPVFGKIQVTVDRAKRFADNVKAKIRGIDPSINYNHNNQDVASGWVKDAESRADGLWLFVEWTAAAVEKIKNKEYRYFSAEYQDSWENPATKTKHQDVLVGGALTNRPFMKNLLPINLSENSISYAFDLVEAINKAKEDNKGDDMDLKKLNELLGLPADTTQEVAFAKLAELKTPPADPGKPTVPAVSLSEELKKLAEENPMVKALIDTVDAQNTALKGFQAGLIEADISKKLSEFDASKIILTPVAKDKVHDFLLEAPVTLHEKFWNILGLLKSSSGLLVELGERAGAGVRYGSAKDSVTLFMDEANRVAQDQKITLDEAMTVVSRNNPELYNGYRAGSYAFNEQ